MDLLAKARHALNFYNDALADHRSRIALHLSGLTAALMLPFALAHVAGGRWTMALVNAVLMVVLVTNARALQRDRARRCRSGCCLS